MSVHRPTRRTAFRVIVVGASLGAGLLLGRFVHDGGTQSELPAAGRALPVLAPSAYGPTGEPLPDALPPDAAPAPDAPATAARATAARYDVAPRADASAPGTPILAAPATESAPPSTTEPTPADSVTVPTEPTTSAPASEAIGEPPVSEPAPAVRDTPIDLDLLLPADAGPVYRLVDPCADGGDACPAGVGGTILAGGIEPLQILNATTDVTPGRFALYDECVRQNGAVGGDQAILAIISNHPARFTISGAWSGSAETSARQRSRYETDRSRGNPHGVVACAVVAAGRRGEIRVHGVDDYDTTADIVRLIDARPLSRKRPPVSVNPTGELTLQVFVPIRENEVTQAVAFRRDPFATASIDCGRYWELGHPADRLPDSTSSQTIVPIPALVLEGSTEFDPAWNRVAVVNVRLTGPSVPYDLCVRWFSREHSYDLPQLIDAETRVVYPPAHPDIRVSVVGLSAFEHQTIDVNHLTVDVKVDEHVPPCGLAPGFPLTVAAGRYATPVPVCALHTGATGDWVYGRVTYFGHVVDEPIHVGTHTCRPGSPQYCGDVVESYIVNVPKPSGDPGGGFVEFRFAYNTPGGGMRSTGSYADTHWEVMGSIPAQVDGQDSEPVLVFGPQLDTFQTRVLPGPGELSRDTLVVQWTSDRPVRTEAFVEGSDFYTCERSPRPRAASTDLATSGVLDLTGLCAGTRHDVGIHLTDEEGRTNTYSNVEGSSGDRSAPGFVATTAGTPVHFALSFNLSNLGSLPAGTTVRLRSVIASVNGERTYGQSYFPRYFLDGSGSLDDLPCADNPAGWRHMIGGTPSSSDYTFAGTWAEDITVWLEVQVYFTQTPCGQPTNANSFHAPSSWLRREIFVSAPLTHQHAVSTVEGGPDRGAYESYNGYFDGPNPVRLQFEVPSLPAAG
jgi:hypothetical protein